MGGGGGGGCCLHLHFEGNFLNRRFDVVIETVINVSSLQESLSEIILRSRGEEGGGGGGMEPEEKKTTSTGCNKLSPNIPTSPYIDSFCSKDNASVV